MISRRDLGRLLALAGLGAALPRQAGAQRRRQRRASGAIKPPRLAPGDTVALVLPASLAFEPSSIDLAREQLEAIGLRVRPGEHVRQRHGYFAGTDAERAADLNAAFADPEVKGIFCFRGGWGTPRLLPLLDYDAIRRHPKPLVGFSDVTALLNAIHQQTGLVTFHGPAAAGNLRPWTLAHLRRVLMSREPIGTLANPDKPAEELVNRTWRTVTVRGGRASGRLAGGNLTLLAVLMGTPWEVDTEGAILLLEDTHEELYRVDRMLTQLAQGGKLAAAAGVVFGHCTDCPPGEGPTFSLEEILHHHLAPLGVPVLSGLAFGHVREKLTLPIGLAATLDADAGTLHLDQAAVV
ncbi:MAG TPA: LD-carboxypeptidase [Thermoanaerobaculia bacterium]|nr:LD-carboxypeptidase [Thermoanaerobaculia bacterium]